MIAIHQDLWNRGQLTDAQCDVAERLAKQHEDDAKDAQRVLFPYEYEIVHSVCVGNRWPHMAPGPQMFACGEEVLRDILSRLARFWGME